MRMPVTRPSPCAIFVAAAVLLTATVPTLASEPYGDAPIGRYGPAIGLGIGTLGLTGEISFKTHEQLVLRINGNWGELSYDETVDANKFSGDVNIYGAGVIADWHPFANGFRLSGGVRYHRSEFSGTATGQDIEINGNIYTPADYGTLTASVSNGNQIAPYLGLGWDSAHYNHSGFSLSIDVGVLYIGDPKASLRSSLTVPGLQDDLDAEVKRIRDDYGRYGNFWPVVNVGAHYRF